MMTTKMTTRRRGRRTNLPSGDCGVPSFEDTPLVVPPNFDGFGRQS